MCYDVKNHLLPSMKNTPETHRDLLQKIARRAMRTRGFFEKFSPEVHAALHTLKAPVFSPKDRDLRDLLWCSIDNDDSEDIDQLTAAEPLTPETTRILVAVADVDALVPQDSTIDHHAAHNTTSVYTAGEIFPMLPEKLSTDMSSLNEGVDRLALVIDMEINEEGILQKGEVYQAWVHNQAKLAYNRIAGWLIGTEEMPAVLQGKEVLAESIKLQIQVAQKMKLYRQYEGALNFETIQARPVFEEDTVTDLVVQQANMATELIEECMVAANGVIARYLFAKNFPSLRRVVRVPKHWDRIVELAHNHGFELPKEPESKALDTFLLAQKKADPLHFPDLSLSVIKLLGPGEYIVEMPGDDPVGHFGLAVSDYAHSTAPNRRYPDLITHRLVKAALLGNQPPYSHDELEELAAHCTFMEDQAKKVERQVEKSADALLLQGRIGEVFDALVTGASERGTWVRLLALPVEGKLMDATSLEVGDATRVKLVHTDVERGFIDFQSTRESVS